MKGIQFIKRIFCRFYISILSFHCEYSSMNSVEISTEILSNKRLQHCPWSCCQNIIADLIMLYPQFSRSQCCTGKDVWYNVYRHARHLIIHQIRKRCFARGSSVRLLFLPPGMSLEFKFNKFRLLSPGTSLVPTGRLFLSRIGITWAVYVVRAFRERVGSIRRTNPRKFGNKYNSSASMGQTLIIYSGIIAF